MKYSLLIRYVVCAMYPAAQLPVSISVDTIYQKKEGIDILHAISNTSGVPV
jgi:hypothetical protein